MKLKTFGWAIAACALGLALGSVPCRAAEPPDGAVNLSLQDALKTALEKNYDVQVQKITRQQADVSLKGSHGIFDPQLSLGWNSQVSRQPASSILQGGLGVYLNRQDAYTLGLSQLTPWGEQFSLAWDNYRTRTNSAFFTLNPSYQSSATLSTTVPLLQGFGRKVASLSVLQARLMRQSAGYQYAQSIRDTLLQVETDYWNLVYAIKSLKVAEHAMDLAKQFQEETRKKIQVGVLAPIEQVSADAQVASREQDIIVAQQSVGDSEDILKLALGYAQDSPEWSNRFVPTDEPTVSTNETPEGKLIEQALLARPELRQLKTKVEKDKLGSHWAKNQTLPQLNLTGSLIYNGTAGYYRNPLTGQVTDQTFSEAWSQVTGRDYKSYFVGLTFSYPIGNRAARYQYQNYRLAQSADEIALEKEKLIVANEVRSALRNLRAAQKRVAAAQLSVKLQEEQLDAEKKKFENGLSTSFEVLSYQDQLVSAQSSLLKAQIDSQEAGASLDRAVGTYLKTHGIELTDASGKPIS